MIRLTKIKRDPKETAKLCQCRPVCKSRRREWKGQEQKTSAELLLERKPLADCFRRWPKSVFPNSPCPLFGRTKRVTIKNRHTFQTPHVVRICQAPVDDRISSPFSHTSSCPLASITGQSGREFRFDYKFSKKADGWLKLHQVPATWRDARLRCHAEGKSSSSNKEFRFDYKFSKMAEGWLKLHQVPATWKEARLRCHAEGNVLASPLTNQLKSAIIDHVREVRGTAPTTIFTGVHASFSKGDYFSIVGVPMLKLPLEWAPGEPDNYLNSESCLVMLTQSNGTVEYNLDARTGSCYKFHRRGLPWSRAYMTCAAEGAHLAIINSAEESQVLKDLYGKNPDNLIFSKAPGIAAIGFHDWGERGRDPEPGWIRPVRQRTAGQRDQCAHRRRWRVLWQHFQEWKPQ
ncbi:C-type lectin [Operophtera brumata]|uniref:C-type lectin n=1 Tax=Operophtera brumata TaxID=104452 RepID=A0A0L7LT05_OPEBR|nr:C-type lectin [Operophtera brumata]